MSLLDIQDVKVTFDTPAGPAHAVRGVDLSVGPGEIVGLVGESGSGKSVTFLALLGLAGPHARLTGRAIFDGTDLVTLEETALGRLRGRRIAMVFQDPASALNPVHRIGRQLQEAIDLNWRDGSGAAPKAADLFAEVGLSDPGRQLRAFPHELSGGQNQRVMIAMMLAGNPDLLIADEPTTALDVTVQAQILDLLHRISRTRGMSVVLISHDLGVVAGMCDTIAVMYAGRIVEYGPVTDVFDAPAHPYLKGLMGARPGSARNARLRTIAGSVPSAITVEKGCAFAPRCGRRLEQCAAAEPDRRGDGRWWRCFNPEPIIARQT